MEVTITIKLPDKTLSEIRRLNTDDDEMSAMSYNSTSQLLKQTVEAVKAEVHKHDLAKRHPSRPGGFLKEESCF